MRLFLALFLISAMLHIGAILLLPAFKVDSQGVKKTVSIDVIERPKPKPRRQKPATGKTAVVKPVPKPAVKPVVQPEPKAEVKADIKGAGTPATSQSAPKIEDIPFVMPLTELPKTATESTPIRTLPKVSGSSGKEENTGGKSVPVDKELAGLESNRKEKVGSDAGNIAREAARAGRGLQGNDIYVFDVLPSEGRNVVYIPPSPEFALENDAKVTLKFYIEKDGRTSGIAFVTRNDTRVEKMAYEYISSMRFDAVIHDEKDSAQITLTFKVR